MKIRVRTSTAVATGLLSVAVTGATVLGIGLVNRWGFPPEPVQPPNQAQEVHDAWLACLSIGYEFDVWESETGKLQYICSEVFAVTEP